MKTVNYNFYSTDKELLKRLAEEYIMIGRDVQIYADKITVFAIPRGSKSRKQRNQDAKRNKR